LQCPALHEGRSDEVALLRGIDDVDPDVTPAGGFAHRQIHRLLVRGADDQRAPHDIIVDKGAGLMINGPSCCQGGQGSGESGADDDHPRSRLQKSLDLTRGDGAAADDQAAFPLNIHRQRIVTWHRFV
jgi:hypothetical protein